MATLKELPALPSVLLKLVCDVSAVKWPVALVGAAVGYLFPESAQREAAGACLALVLLDTMTGSVAARVSGEAISSAKFGRALVKVLAYFSTVFVVVNANHNIPGAKQFQGASVVLVLTLIQITESISVLENCRKMGFRLPLGLDSWLQGRLATAGVMIAGKEGEKNEKAEGGD